MHASTVNLERCVTSGKTVGFLWERTSWLCKSDGLGLDSQAFYGGACSLLGLGSGVLGAVFVEVKRKYATLRQ